MSRSIQQGGTEREKSSFRRILTLFGIEGFARAPRLSDIELRRFAEESLAATLENAAAASLAGWSFAKIEGIDNVGIVGLIDSIVRSAAVEDKLTSLIRRVGLQGVTFVKHRIMRGHPQLSKGRALLVVARAIVFVPPSFDSKMTKPTIVDGSEFRNSIGVPGVQFISIAATDLRKAAHWLLGFDDGPVELTEVAEGSFRLRRIAGGYWAAEILRLGECLSHHCSRRWFSGVGSEGMKVAREGRSKLDSWQRARHEKGLVLDEGFDEWKNGRCIGARATVIASSRSASTSCRSRGESEKLLPRR